LIPFSVAIIGIFLSLFLGSIVRNGERKVVRTSFRTNLEKGRSAIRAKLSSYREALMSLALFMEASELATNNAMPQDLSLTEVRLGAEIIIYHIKT